jgi:beta-glucosidase
LHIHYGARAFSTESGARGQGYIEKNVFSLIPTLRVAGGNPSCMAPAKRCSSVALDIASVSFASYEIHMKNTVEPGEFEITAGKSSRDADLQKVILTVTK